MTITIGAPDGSSIQFPDGTDDATIKSVMAKHYPKPMGAGEDMAKSILPGLAEFGAGLGNTSDSLTGGAGMRDFANEQLAKSGSKEQMQSPSQMLLGLLQKVTGPLHQSQTVPGQYVRAIASFAPAAIGGPEGIASKIASVVAPAVASETAGQATKGTRYEGVARLLGSLGGGGVSGVRFNSVAEKAAPTVAALKSAAHDAYAKAENAGVMVAPDSFAAMVEKTRNDLANEGIDKSLHPNSMAAFNRLQETADTNNPITLKGMDIQRQIAADAANKSAAVGDAGDKRLAYTIKNNIDDFVNGLKPNNLVGSQDPQAAIDALNNARGLWAKASKGDIIQKRIDRAATRAGQYSQSGEENALRVEFRQLAMNDKAMARFSPAEQAAIKQVAKGDATTNALRLLGKFSPHGVVSTALGISTGFAAGGLVGAVALPVTGLIAKALATQKTKAAAQAARDQMTRGGPAQSNPLLTYTNPYPLLTGGQ
jgi:hypothetical protein